MTTKTWWSGINGVEPLTLAEVVCLQAKYAHKPNEKYSLLLRSEQYELWAQAGRIRLILESESEQTTASAGIELS